MPRETKVYHLKVDSSGRIVLPADARLRSKIAEGDTVTLVEDSQGLHIKSKMQALAEARKYFAKLAPAGLSLSEEILADRRLEAARE
jgi:AbrB family looped-hinge helix DNA binding protein